MDGLNPSGVKVFPVVCVLLGSRDYLLTICVVCVVSRAEITGSSVEMIIDLSLAHYDNRVGGYGCAH